MLNVNHETRIYLYTVETFPIIPIRAFCPLPMADFVRILIKKKKTQEMCQSKHLVSRSGGTKFNRSMLSDGLSVCIKTQIIRGSFPYVRIHGTRFIFRSGSRLYSFNLFCQTHAEQKRTDSRPRSISLYYATGAQ